MRKELTTLEDAIAHAVKNGRDWSTDRAVKHGDPENREYWLIAVNPSSLSQSIEKDNTEERP